MLRHGGQGHACKQLAHQRRLPEPLGELAGQPGNEKHHGDDVKQLHRPILP